MPATPDVILPIVTSVTIALLAATADWRRFGRSAEAHLFWGTVTAVALLRHVGADALPGVQLLGAAAAGLLLGLRVSAVALAVGIGVQHALDGTGPLSWATTWLLAGLLPAAVTRAVATLLPRVEPRRLGPLPAIALAFVAGAASMVAVIACSAWLGRVPPVAPHDTTVLFALAAAMALAEAQLAGVVAVLVAVQRPDWLLRRTHPVGRRRRA